MRLNIPFHEIPPQGRWYDCGRAGWFPDGDIRRTAPVRAAVLLRRKDQETVELEGSLGFEATLTCDCCLRDYGAVFESDFSLIVACGEDPFKGVADLEISPEELDTLRVADPVVDLGDILRQQVLLALPAKALCSEACKGLCPGCGADLNQGPCGCAGTRSVSPFAVLSGLLGTDSSGNGGQADNRARK